jgi:zinc protease
MALRHTPRHRGALAPATALALVASLVATAGAAPLKVPYQSFTLDNGLRVILHEDHSVPVISVNTWYHVGSGDEKPGRTGFAHLFEHIMFEDGPSNALALMLWLDSDRMGHLLPEITAEKVDLQRGVVQNERRQSYENQPYGLAEENILKRLYPAEHPYHWPVIGSMADLSAATIEDVREFFTKFYTPNNATVCIAGDIRPAETRRLVESWFGDIPRGPELTRPVAPAFTLPADVYATLEDRVQVPRLYNAWHSTRTWAPDDAALQVMGHVLAGGKTSRLYKRLVYELQIANQVYAYQDAGRLDGKFAIVSTARTGHDLNALQRVIDEEVSRLAAAGPTAREMERVRNSIEAEFIGGMERVGGFGGKANQLNQYAYFAGEPDSFERDLDRYRAVSAADVQRVATRYLAQAKRVVLSVVPQGRTELAATQGVQP